LRQYLSFFSGYIFNPPVLIHTNGMNELGRLYQTDAELLAGLTSGSDRALTQIYRRYFPMVLHLVLANSGDEDDAKDIYQEALVVVYEQVSGGSLELHCQLKTYLYSISRRLWLKALSRRGRFAALTDTEEAEDVTDDLAQHETRNRQFEQMAASLGKLGEPCRTLLEDFYIREMSMQAITEKFGYTNADNAKTQKYKCLQRLKRLFFADYQEDK
jgi:RNA polymerase sigma factor (sigma-70 family)